ncbi:Bug family tripartite tricarboxylate transporter substrate binding protein [Roseococcus sp. YIM B11640]|uniref:Bug family tripartite tricarboxylate transporter substrate binding protein n=1 Tax=Roseococcus sp. YIM B11640 TaxID=3133973 RepID=UPI003C79991E
MLRRPLLLAATLPAVASAQERPVRLVIAFPPGGSTDTLGRLIAPRMAELLGTTVTPENRSGASGAVGAGVVAQAVPDGGSLLLDSGGQAVNPFLLRGLSFDYRTAFAPVTLLVTLPLLLVVRADLGVTTLAGLLERLRAQPRLAAYGSVGIGARTHLAMAALLRRAGITAEHIPYRGGADQITGLLRGDVAMGFTSVALAAPLLREGQIRSLGTSLPGVADSIDGQGFPGFSIGDWIALLAPAGTSTGIISRQAEAAADAIGQPALRPRLAELGMAPAAEGPQALARFLDAERRAMGGLIASEGIRLDG